MTFFELAAIVASTCWALTGLLAARPAAHLGAIGFNRARMCFAFLLLGVYVLISDAWHGFDPQYFWLVIASGFVGIFIGDTALFLALNRIGPRRNSILYALNGPISALLGWWWLGEVLPLRAVGGITLVVLGVVLAIAFGNKSETHWDAVKGPLWVGLLLGLTSALSQSLGSIIVRPVMKVGMDPIAVAVIRVGVAALCLSLLMQLPSAMFKQKQPLTWSVAGRVALIGAIGLGGGMTLILYALSGGNVGIVSTLSATTPVQLLFLLWIRDKTPPALGAWIGAIFVVAGSALIMVK